MQSHHTRALTVAASVAAGYFVSDRVYRYVRSRSKPDVDVSKDWVCPGVGAAGAAVVGLVTGLSLYRGTGNSDSAASSSPAIFPSAAKGCPVMKNMGGKLDLAGFTMHE